MMRRSGRIIAVADDRLVVRFERAAACGSCHAAKVCGSAHTTDLELAAAGCGSRTGDEVEVELDPATALRGLAITHLLPLFGLLGGMALAGLIRLSDPGIAGLSFAGLGLALILSRRLARHPALRPAPRLTSDSLSAIDPTIYDATSVSAPCSSPFKGEARRGMGHCDASQTHPHPSPPLEGEGATVRHSTCRRPIDYRANSSASDHQESHR